MRFRFTRAVRLGVLLGIFAAVAVPVAVAGSAAEPVDLADPQVSDGAAVVPGAYIVQLAEEPVANYAGGVPGFEATKPGRGQKIDPESPKVRRYVEHLQSRHDAALQQAGGGKKLYDYHYAYNGFAARLSDAQAAKLKALPNVVSVEPVEEWAPTTSDTPRFLGLTGPGNLWAQLGGPSSGTNSSNATGAGEGVVVGVVDTGIWPEHPSVSDRIGNKLMYKNLPHFKGKCASAETVTDGSWDANLCNQKLVAAQFFIATFDEFSPRPLAPNDFRSPRDSDGHGTHTATTAAGNHNITPTGAAAGFGPISGMAPRARIAAYKACWDDGDPNTGGCFTSDTAAAIDRAVADGVDVINFSISGTTTSFLNVVEVAAFNAAAAGVFVAMSAGNTPGASTVAHPSPWVTTVAASTHDRPAVGRVTLGSGATFDGVSQMTGSLGPRPLIRAQDAGLPGANANLLRQCFSQHEPNSGGNPVLDPAKVAGKIVVCERGGTAPNNARVDKSRAVQIAGGVGMVLVNTAPNSLNGDLHFVPTVHLPDTNLAAVQTYAQTAGATATLSKVAGATVNAPEIAAFSSRGPSLATADQLKPDVSAPGVDVLAGYSPASIVQPGFLFNMVSGTSMSSPHVAGLAALLRHKHPTWSPAMMKSALMTTANDLVGTFAGSATASADANRAFAQGAGHVRPTRAADPGLVFDSGPVDWLRFICGTGQLPASECTPFGGPIDPSDLNLASITIGDLAGVQTVTRRVTSVGAGSETYTSSVSGLPGITVATPAPFTIAQGASQALSLTFTRTTAPLNVYQSGFLTLTGSNGHIVRVPLTVRPVPLAAPTEVTSTGGPVSWDVKTGYNGTLNAPVRGLLPATETAFTVAQDPDATFTPTSSADTFARNVVLPGNSLFRATISEDAITPTGTDLDLYVHITGGGLVGISADGDSNESVTLRNTGAGAIPLTIFVHGFSTNGPSATGTLFDWVVGPASAGNTTVTGVGPATIGGVQTHTATFTGLLPGKRYLGQVDYNDGTTVIGRTIISVRT